MAYMLENGRFVIDPNASTPSLVSVSPVNSSGQFYVETQSNQTCLHSTGIHRPNHESLATNSYIPIPGGSINVQVSSNMPSSNSEDSIQKIQFLEHLKQLRADRKYCDIAINVNGRQFWAHRIILAAWSPLFDRYMSQMSAGSYSDYQVMLVHYDNYEVFSDLLDFLYSGCIAPRETNFMQLLHLAVSFQIDPLRRDCEEYLRSNLHLENFLRTFFISIKYGLASLEEFVLEYLQQNLADAVTQNEFLSLSVAKLNKFLSSGRMPLMKPEIKLFLIISWVGCNVSGRQRFLVLLLKHIDWSTVASDFLLEISRTDNFFTSHESGLFLLLQTLHSSNISLGPYESIFPHLQQTYTYLLSDVLNIVIPPESIPEAEDLYPIGIQMISSEAGLQIPSFCLEDKAINTDVTGPDIEASQEETIPLPPIPSFIKSNYDSGETSGMQQKSVEGTIYILPGQSVHSHGKPEFKQSNTSYSENVQNDVANSSAMLQKKGSQNISTEQFVPEKLNTDLNKSHTFSDVLTFEDISQDASLSNDGMKMHPYDQSLEKVVGNSAATNFSMEDSVCFGHSNCQQLLINSDCRVPNNADVQVVTAPIKQSSHSYVFVETADTCANDLETPSLGSEGNKSYCSGPRFENQTFFATVSLKPKEMEIQDSKRPKRQEKKPSKYNEFVTKVPRNDKMDTTNNTFSHFSSTGTKIQTKKDNKLQYNLQKSKTGRNNTGFYKRKTTLRKIKRKCSECTFSCSFVKELHEHMAKKHQKKNTLVHKCDLCGYSGKGKEFFDHMRKHHPGPPFKCTFQESCNFEGKSIHALLLHRTSHTRIRQYSCNQCQMSFFSRNNLIQHNKTHTDERPYKCKICGSAHKTNCTLKQHMAIHSAERQYLCDACGFSTKYHSHLKSHQRIHSGEVFHCEVEGCNYFTVKKSQLKCHMKIHSNVRNFFCEECGKAFKAKSHLNRHEMMHKSDIEEFKCSEITHTDCEFKSKRKDKLKEHIQKYHGNDSPGKMFRARKKRLFQATSSPTSANEKTGKSNIHKISRNQTEWDDHAYTRPSSENRLGKNQRFSKEITSPYKIIYVSQGEDDAASVLPSKDNAVSLSDTPFNGMNIDNLNSDKNQTVKTSNKDCQMLVVKHMPEKKKSQMVSLLNINSECKDIPNQNSRFLQDVQ